MHTMTVPPKQQNFGCPDVSKVNCEESKELMDRNAVADRVSFRHHALWHGTPSNSPNRSLHELMA